MAHPKVNSQKKSPAWRRSSIVLRNKLEDIADPGDRHKLFKRRRPSQKTPIITQAQSVIQQIGKEEGRAKKEKEESKDLTRKTDCCKSAFSYRVGR
jgi:hypothetical protein